MNKKELISKVMKDTGHTNAVVRSVVDSLFETISDEMTNGGSVKVVGFATFGTKTRAARKGVSPKDTSVSIEIPEKVVPSVRFGKSLKSKVNGEAVKVENDD